MNCLGKALAQSIITMKYIYYINKYYYIIIITIKIPTAELTVNLSMLWGGIKNRLATELLYHKNILATELLYHKANKN